MRRTRILLVEMPRMLGDIITDIVSSQPDMEVVGDLRTRQGLPSAIGTAGADVVMLGLLDSELPSDCVAVFDVHPWIRLLGVAADGRWAFLYELQPQRQPLGEVSPHGLVAVIRAGGARVTR